MRLIACALLCILSSVSARDLVLPLRRVSRPSMPSRRAEIVSMGSGGDYYIDVSFAGTVIPTLVDTGSSILAVPGPGFKALQCSCETMCPSPSAYKASIDGLTCLNDFTPTFGQDCCTQHGQLTPYYSTDTGTPGTFASIACYGSGGYLFDTWKDQISLASGNSSSEITLDTSFAVQTENLCSGSVYFHYSSTAASNGFGTAIMGLGYGDSPENTMNQFTAAGLPNSFGLYMCPSVLDSGGNTESLGVLSFQSVSDLIGSSLSGGSVFRWIRIIPDETHYSAYLASVSILESSNTSQSYGTATASSSAQQNVIFDSGTALLGNLPAFAAEEVRSALNSFATAKGIAGPGFQEFMNSPGKCFQFQGEIIQFPIILLTFENADGTTVQLPLSPNIYLTAGCSEPGFINSAWLNNGGGVAGAGFSILGNAFLSQFNTIWDRDENAVGFAAATTTSRQEQCRCVYGRQSQNGCSCFPGASGAECSKVSTATFATAQSNFNKLIGGNTNVVVTVPNDGSSSKAYIWYIVIAVVIVAACAVFGFFWLRAKRFKMSPDHSDTSFVLLENDHLQQPTPNQINQSTSNGHVDRERI